MIARLIAGPFQNRAKLWIRVFAALAVVLGCVYRFYLLDHKVAWHDELLTATRISGFATYTLALDAYVAGNPLPRTALEIKSIFEPSESRGYREILHSGYSFPQVPFYYLLARAWTKSFGGGLTSLRTLSASIGVFALLAVFYCGRKLSSALVLPESFSYILLSLVAVSPIHVLLSQEARMYSLLLLITALSTATFCKLQGSARKTTALAFLILTIIGILSHLLYLLVVAGQATFFILNGTYKKNQSYLKFGLMLLAILAVAFLYMGLRFGELAPNHFSTIALPKGHLLPTAIDAFATSFSLLRLAGKGEFVELQPFLIHAQFNVFAVLIVLFLALVSLRPIVRKPASCALLLLLWGPIFLFFSLDFLVGGQRSVVMRYYTISAFAAQILIAAILSRLLSPTERNRIHPRFVLGCTIWTALLALGCSSVAISAQNVDYHKLGADLGSIDTIASEIDSSDAPVLLYLVKPQALLPLILRLDESVLIDSLPSAFNDNRIASEYRPQICNNSKQVYLLRSTREPQDNFLLYAGLSEETIFTGEHINLAKLSGVNCTT